MPGGLRCATRRPEVKRLGARSGLSARKAGIHVPSQSCEIKSKHFFRVLGGYQHYYVLSYLVLD